MKLLLNIALGAFVLTVAHAAWTEPNAEAKHDDEAIGTLPLLRGALWWLVPPCTDWSNERLEQAIQAQCDIGFDLLWIFNTPGLLDQAEQAAAATPNGDFLEMVYAIADAKDMRVIADLPKGGWHGKAPAADMLAINRDYIARYAARYGGHPSFWGWYLNYEINPIAPDDTQQTAFWREVWRDVVQACHNAAPGSVVTISPFFLLDDAGHRGFRYQTPEEYARWWGATMKATGIDILMLQDSGEHLSFFTIEQREPFFAAVAKACHDADAQFWVNVETGEAHVADWDEYLALTKEKKVPWRFTPIDWLEKKLQLAARHGDGIINWGYFPFMDPLATQADFAGGGPITGAKPLEAYEAYKTYYERIKEQRARN